MKISPFFPLTSSVVSDILFIVLGRRRTYIALYDSPYSFCYRNVSLDDSTNHEIEVAFHNIFVTQMNAKVEQTSDICQPEEQGQ